MSIGKKIGIGIVILLIVIQFFQINRENPPADLSKDFIQLTQPSGEIASLLHAACYDCHSHSTNYPWYTYISPISWMIRHDIEEGREHLNFANWSDYDADKADHKLEECMEELEEGEMPLEGYVMLHPEAQLSDEQKMTLLNWFASLRKR